VFILLFVFAALAEDVWFKEAFSWDIPIMLSIHHLASPVLDRVMWLVTQTGNSGAAAVALILALYFSAKRQRTNVLSVLAIFGGAVALNTLMKLLFARPRPAVFIPLVHEQSYSFPSGHVTASVAAYGFLAVLLWQNRHRVLAILSGLWVAAVAVSRVYLGVHYPSDVLGAFVFSSLWFVLLFVVRDRHADKTRQLAY